MYDEGRRNCVEMDLEVMHAWYIGTECVLFCLKKHSLTAFLGRTAVAFVVAERCESCNA